MWNTLLILMAVLATIGFTVMHYSALLGILTIIIAVVLTVLNLLLLKKLPKILKNFIMCAGVIACMVLFWFMKPQTVKYKITDYSEEIIKVEKMAGKDSAKAEKMLEKLSEKYGETDSILGIQSYLCLMDDDYDGAYDALYRVKDHTSQEYYRRMELLLLLDTRSDTTSQLYNMYEEAAKIHTDWGYIQRMAGVAKFEQKKYDSAQYYLLSAVTIDETDAMAYYYLGASACEKGKYEDAAEYFNSALEYGVSEEVQSWIAWYVERMG
ncbi:MAG: hypothetical protein II919_00770 [Lachnospiraceae bacterium]|nr:hypothetical protein [Lachnospiraceae bacterium]